MADHNGSRGPGQGDGLQVRKQRTRSRPLPIRRLSTTKSMSVLAPTVEENSKESESEKQLDAPRTVGKSNASGSSDKENKAPPDDVSGRKPSSPHSRPESACSVSKEKSTTIHSQPIDQLKYMESNLSLMTGIPMKSPKSFRTPIKEDAVHSHREKAAERASRHSEELSVSNVPRKPASLPTSNRSSEHGSCSLGKEVADEALSEFTGDGCPFEPTKTKSLDIPSIY
jgi:hypothetical protein